MGAGDETKNAGSKRTKAKGTSVKRQFFSYDPGKMGVGDETKNAGSKRTKAKGHHDKRKFQLFDPSVKSDLTRLCDDGLELLQLENQGDAEEADRSLNFEEGSSDEDDVEILPVDSGPPGDPVRVAGLVCGSCGVKFGDVSEQRVHYTLDWHRYNVKRRLHGGERVSEACFDNMIDELSSIDGSDEEEDVPADEPVSRLLEKLSELGPVGEKAEQPRLSGRQKFERSPKAFFRNGRGQILTCFKTILSSGLEKENNLPNRLVSYVNKPLRITVIMASGGHFAAAVFEGNTVSLHKTFHSYTTRAKQGTSQSAHDGKSGTKNAKSAGASLRRYNQQSFTQHVQDLLTSWKSSVAGSDLVFYKAISANANVLFSSKNPVLSKESKNLRTIPFPTKRPTFSEVKRVHSLLTTVHLYDSMETFLAAHTNVMRDRKAGKSPSKSPSKRTVDRAKSRSPKRKDEFVRVSEESESDGGECELVAVDHSVDFSGLKEYDDSLTPEQRKKTQKRRKNKVVKAFRAEGVLGEVYDALQEGNVTLEPLVLQLRDSGEDVNGVVEEQGSTLLHVAARNSDLDAIWSLLNSGCDPAVKDKNGKVPYNYAESRECRDHFRKFMKEFPDKFDYKKAQVPPPLSDELERERAEKKRQQNKLKREKQKQKLSERKEKEKETEEQRRFLGLSDREKRALAAEQRILAQCKRNAEKAPVLVRCFDCASDITGKVPFEYNQNVFCTTKCLASHRKKFPEPLSV